jgi:hypothetical protein
MTSKISVDGPRCIIDPNYQRIVSVVIWGLKLIVGNESHDGALQQQDQL